MKFWKRETRPGRALIAATLASAAAAVAVAVPALGDEGPAPETTIEAKDAAEAVPVLEDATTKAAICVESAGSEDDLQPTEDQSGSEDGNAVATLEADPGDGGCEGGAFLGDEKDGEGYAGVIECSHTVEAMPLEEAEGESKNPDEDR